MAGNSFLLSMVSHQNLSPLAGLALSSQSIVSSGLGCISIIHFISRVLLRLWTWFGFDTSLDTSSSGCKR